MTEHEQSDKLLAIIRRVIELYLPNPRLALDLVRGVVANADVVSRSASVHLAGSLQATPGCAMLGELLAQGDQVLVLRRGDGMHVVLGRLSKLGLDDDGGHELPALGTAELPLSAVYANAVSMGALNLPSPTTPAALSANTNDWSLPEFGGVIRASATGASRDVTGIVARADHVYMLINIGTINIVLKHDNAGSAAANRMLLSDALDWTMGPGNCAMLWYDGASSRWRHLSGEN